MREQSDRDILAAGVQKAQERLAEVDSGANNSWRCCLGTNTATCAAMKYEFHLAALQEYAEAVEFFAQQDKQQDFIDTIESAIFKIVAAPERWPIGAG
jgi:hypothetical protein